MSVSGGCQCQADVSVRRMSVSGGCQTGVMSGRCTAGVRWMSGGWMSGGCQADAPQLQLVQDGLHHLLLASTGVHGETGRLPHPQVGLAQPAAHTALKGHCMVTESTEGSTEWSLNGHYMVTAWSLHGH